MEFGQIKGSKAGGCFSRVGASSLINLPKLTHRREVSKLENESEQPEDLVPIDSYLDKMLEGVNIDYQRSKQRLKKLQQQRLAPKKPSIRSSSQTVFRIRRDVDPTMPSMEFMLSVDKCEKFRKPTGCSLSVFIQQRLENEQTPKQDISNSRIYKIAEREFKKEIAHMRKGMESLKSINLRK